MRGLRVGITGAVVALVTVVATGGAPASAGEHGGEGHVIKVKMLDKCDPVSFNLALGPGACSPVREARHPVTFDELLASFDPVAHTASPAWAFNRAEYDARPGDTLRVTNRGGEGHSFTEVPFFGGGCVDPINDALGLTGNVAANCPADFATVLPPGGTGDITVTTPGEHKYICVIHPWMKATVDVEGDDD